MAYGYRNRSYGRRRGGGSRGVRRSYGGASRYGRSYRAGGYSRRAPSQTVKIVVEQAPTLGTSLDKSLNPLRSRGPRVRR